MLTATRLRRVPALVGLCLLAFGVAAAPATARSAEPGDGVPTFAGDVAAIFQAKCQVCHRPGMMAPMSLLTYQDARPWARAIRQRVMLREMPPWHLDKTVGITRYKGDRSLTDEQIDTVIRWVDGGAPLGNPADLPPPLAFNDDEWTIGVPDLIVTSPEAVMYPEGSDWWPSYVVDPGLTETRYARAVETRPSREGREFVHHAIASLIDPDARDTPARLGQGEPVIDPLEGAYLSEYAPGKYGDIFPENHGACAEGGGQDPLQHALLRHRPRDARPDQRRLRAVPAGRRAQLVHHRPVHPRERHHRHPAGGDDAHRHLLQPAGGGAHHQLPAAPAPARQGRSAWRPSTATGGSRC